MTIDREFWDTMVKSWISIRTQEEKNQTENFARRLAEQQRNPGAGRVKSILEELLEEED